VIALGAVDFTVQFGINSILNITYGSLTTLAAYLGHFLVGAHLSIWLALAIGAVMVGLASMVFHRVLLAPLVRRGIRPFGLIVVTVACGIVLRYVIVAVVGPTAQSYGEQSGATLHILGMTFTVAQVVSIAITAVLMLSLHLLLTRTKLGRAMRATSANRTLAQSCGIATDRISDIAWLISGTLCGAAGVALAITVATFDFTLGSVFLIPMIAAAEPGGSGPALRRDAGRVGGGDQQPGGGRPLEPRVPGRDRLRDPDREVAGAPARALRGHLVVAAAAGMSPV